MPGLRAINVKVAKRPGLSPISCERREHASKAASCAIRKSKPTQLASGPKFIDKPKASPLLPRRRLPMSFVPCTAASLFKNRQSDSARSQDLVLRQTKLLQRRLPSAEY